MHPRAQFRDPAAATRRAGRLQERDRPDLHPAGLFRARDARRAEARLLLAVEEGQSQAGLARCRPCSRRLGRAVSSPQVSHPRAALLLGHYLKVLYTCARDNRGALQAVGTMAAFYLHLGPFSRVVSQAMARQIEEIDSGRWRSPAAPIDSTMTGEEFLTRLKNSALKRRAGRSAHA